MFYGWACARAGLLICLDRQYIIIMYILTPSITYPLTKSTSNLNIFINYYLLCMDECAIVDSVCACATVRMHE